MLETRQESTYRILLQWQAHGKWPMELWQTCSTAAGCAPAPLEWGFHSPFREWFRGFQKKHHQLLGFDVLVAPVLLTGYLTERIFSSKWRWWEGVIHNQNNCWSPSIAFTPSQSWTPTCAWEWGSRVCQACWCSTGAVEVGTALKNSLENSCWCTADFI